MTNRQAARATVAVCFSEINVRGKAFVGAGMRGARSTCFDRLEP